MPSAGDARGGRGDASGRADSEEPGITAELRIADEFIYDIAGIYSQRVLDEIKNVVGMLAEFPDLGSPVVRESIRQRFGDGVRKLPVSTFVIIYRYTEPADGNGNGYVDVLACVHGKRIV